MNGLKIIDLLEQVKNQRYTYSELVDEGIEVELGSRSYTVYSIDKPLGNKAYGKGEGKNGINYALLFYRELSCGLECYSLVEALKAELE
jgi:hypothetical protein